MMIQGEYLKLLLVLFFVDFRCVSASHMRGGSISWRAVNSSTVEISYWLAWRYDFDERGHEPCTEAGYQSQSFLDFGKKLKYKGPADVNYTEVYDIRYQCTDYNPDIGWVAGAGKFNYTSATQEFTISMVTCCWVTLMNFVSPRDIRLTTGIDLAEFSSAGEINNSPIAYTVPLQRVQQTCNAFIRISVSDPDGDDVRCRWANNNERKNDCDNVCGPLPEPIELNKRGCIISMENVDLAPGKYAVTVMVEDFISTSSRKALSKIPLQFILEIFATDRSICAVPYFIAPTPWAGSCYPIPAGEPMFIRIAARNSDPTRPIAEIASVGLPLGMVKTAINTVPGAPTDYYVDLRWTPPANHRGNYQMCFIAQDRGADGEQTYASEQFCVTINVGGSLVNVVPERSTPSPDDVVPTSIYSWTIMFDHEIDLPKQQAMVTFLNANGDVTHAVSVHDSSEATHAMRTPDRHGIVIDTPQFFLEPNTQYTIRVHKGVGQAFRSGCGYLLSEFAEWNFSTNDFGADLAPGNREGPDGLQMPKPIPDCRSSYMVIYIPKQLIGDVDPSTMHLQDSSCTGGYHNETHYSIGTAYGMCGTSVQDTSNSEGEPMFHYENIVHIPSQPYFNGSTITRKHHIEIHVSCMMANQRPIMAEFDPNVTTIIYHEAAYGEFQFSLYMCRDGSFLDKYRSAEFPVDVDLRQRLYFEARQYHSGDTGIFLQSCKATPTSNPLDNIFYEFLKNGCPVDDTVVIHDPPNPRKARFSIESFAFLGHFIGGTVFVHCEMSVCFLNDLTCTQTCDIPEHAIEEEEVTNEISFGTNGGLPVAKRDVSDTTLTSMSYTNTDGPIKIRANRAGPSSKAGGETSHYNDSGWFSDASMIEISLVTINLFILLVLFVVVLRVHAMLRRKKNKQSSHAHIRKIHDPITLDMSALSKQQ